MTDPALKSGISVRKLISTLKKKNAQVGNDLLNILPKSSHERKKPSPNIIIKLAYIIFELINLWWFTTQIVAIKNK